MLTFACWKVIARSSSSSVAVAGRFFVVGGLGTNGDSLSSIEVYTPSNNSWVTFAELPSGRSETGCAASGNNLVIAGGNSGLQSMQDSLANFSGRPSHRFPSVDLNCVSYAAVPFETSVSVDCFSRVHRRPSHWCRFQCLEAPCLSIAPTYAGTNSSGNGDLKEVYAIDANKGNLTRLADLQYARFGLQLVGLPSGDVVAVGGGQHLNQTEVLIGN